MFPLGLLSLLAWAQQQRSGGARPARSDEDLHLLNAPSPGATASLAIADELIEKSGL